MTEDLATWTVRALHFERGEHDHELDRNLSELVDRIRRGSGGEGEGAAC
jgi:ribosomal protein S15P/S13E